MKLEKKILVNAHMSKDELAKCVELAALMSASSVRLIGDKYVYFPMNRSQSIRIKELVEEFQQDNLQDLAYENTQINVCETQNIKIITKK